MINLFSYVKESSEFRKLEVDELLFVEYRCMHEQTKSGIWSESNYFAFISSGRKAWKSIEHDYEVNTGDILFIKKGANLTHQFFDEDFCAIFFFIPDAFIRSFFEKNPRFLQTSQKDLSKQDSVLQILPDELLTNYYRSIVSYFSLSEKPNEELLKLKIEELLLSLCTSDNHKSIKDYFISLCQNQAYQMTQVMEANFCYNLKIEDYARLCNLSLSAFKRAFKQFYKTTPAAWLKQRKLDLSHHRLLTSDLPISQVSFECGFEDTSHFIRVFKAKYKLTPHQYRQQRLQKALTISE
jgi:AraC-like DNA-binding protein